MDAIVELTRASPLTSPALASSYYAKLTEAISKGGKKFVAGAERVLAEGILSPEGGHALACAELLHLRLQHGTPLDAKNGAEALDHARACFFALTPRDALLASKAVTNISRQITKLLITVNQPMRGLGAFKAIVNTITEASPSVVTAVHTDLLLLTLKAHAYDLLADMPFLTPQRALLQLQPSSWPIETVDYLQLWYYLGMYHSAWQHFAAAAESFQQCMLVPNNGAVSAVQVEAYKKLVLVNLLATGEAPVLNPRLTAPSLQRYVEALCVPYADLARAYRKCVSSSGAAGSSAGSSAHLELHHLVSAHADVFVADTNMGLVKQIVASLSKKQVTRLTQTYLTCSLDDVAAHMAVAQPQHHGGAAAAAAASGGSSTANAERMVFSMICAGDVFARLDSGARMVRFLDDPQEYDDSASIARMDARIQEVTALNEQMAERERQLAVAPAFILKTMRGAAGRGEGGAGSSQEAMELAVARGLSMQDVGGRGDSFAMGAEDDEEMRAAMQASLMQQ